MARVRAALITSPGEPDVIEIAELEPPEPRAGEVSIDVAWAGVNFVDLLQRRGTYLIEPPFICGSEVSGRIRAIGEGVTELAQGDEVAAFTDTGGYAEVALARADHVVALTDGLGAVSLRDAACAPIVGVTTVALIDLLARVKEGETVLVNGAAGGMGSVLARVAKHRGASQVIGTVGSDRKRAVAKGFGYDEVLLRDSLPESLSEIAPDGVDVALDPVGGETFRHSFEALRTLGRMVRFGNASGATDEPLPTSPLIYTNRTISGFSLRRLSAARPEIYRGLLANALTLIASDALPIEIREEYALSEAVEVHRLMESGQTTGKLLIVPK